MHTGSCIFTFKALCCRAPPSQQHCLVQFELLYLTTYSYPVKIYCLALLLLLAPRVPKNYSLKFHTQVSFECLGLKYSTNCIYCIKSYSKVAQLQYELIYLCQAWRGQHFFHTFEKSLGGRKRTSRNCCIIFTWVGIMCLCVYICVGLRYETCVRLLAVL